MSSGIFFSVGIPILFSIGQSNSTRKILIVMLKMFYYLMAMGSLIILVLVAIIRLNSINPIITGTAILVSIALLTYVTEIKLRANMKMIRDPSRSLYT